MRSALADDTQPEIANPPETMRPRPRLVPPASPAIGTRGPASVRSAVAAPRASRPQPPSARPVSAVAAARPAAPALPAPVAVRPPPVAPMPTAPGHVAELPADDVSEVRRKSYAAAPKPVRPMSWNGAPPTGIRDLDGLFAKDRDRRQSITSRPPARPPVSTAAPVDPAYFAQQLLQKVQADFTPPPSRAPREALIAAAPPGQSPPFASAPRAAAPSPLAAPRVPALVAFVPTPTTLPYDETVQLALPDDDDDLALLVPWYRRLWNKLFGR